MWTKWLAVGLIVAAAVFTGVDMARMYPLLPDQIASHFDAEGVPDGWCTKEKFVRMCGITFLGLGLFFCFLPKFVQFLPTSQINLPNKDYWLSPEQKTATWQFLTAWLWWFAALTLWLLAIVFRAAMIANLQQPPRLMPMWWLLGGFFAAVVVMVIVFVRRFPRTDALSS